MYSIPAPLTSSREQFCSGAALRLRTRDMSYFSVTLVLMRGTEQPVSSRTLTVYFVGPHDTIVVVIGLLPQRGLIGVFSDEAGFRFSLPSGKIKKLSLHVG